MRDKRLLGLIGSFLRVGERSVATRTKGTRQGGTLSPLLANLYLDRFDREMEARGLAFVRYADDIAIYARSQRAAERVKGSVVKWLEENLKVPVNREKSGAGLCEGSNLLVHRNGRVGIAPKAYEKLKERVRKIWNARQSGTSVELRDRWREYIEGWWNYFRLADTWELLPSIGKWTRPASEPGGWRRARTCNAP